MCCSPHMTNRHIRVRKPKYEFNLNGQNFRSICDLLKKLYFIASLFGYQSKSSPSAACSMSQTLSSNTGLETASRKPARIMASDHSSNVQKVCSPANNSYSSM